jgi:SM-20-related protein
MGDGMRTEQLETLADALVEKGYLLLDAALSPALANALRSEALMLDADEWAAAGVGRRHDHQVMRAVRNDRICWLEPSMPAARQFLEQMGQLQQWLNRNLFMGLFDFEAHYACYPPGHFYRRHVDAFRGRSNRILTVVYYLNDGWKQGDGGELWLYPDDISTQPVEVVAPRFNRMLVFLSERFPHEVRPARTTRYSIAGWFRVNTSHHGRVDPVT